MKPKIHNLPAKVSLLLLCSSLTIGSCGTANSPWMHTPVDLAAVNSNQSTEHKWWKVFNSPLMDQLAELLASQNLEIKLAQARILEARASNMLSAANLYPNLNAQGSLYRGDDKMGTTKPQNINNAGFNASWELDLFGSNSKALKAAEARTRKAIAEEKATRNLMLAELFQAVIRWQQAEKTRAEAIKLLKAQDEQVELFFARTQAGLVDETYLSRSQAQREQTATLLPNAEANKATAEYQIEQLLGKQSGTMAEFLELFANQKLNVPEAESALNIELETIRNRPDVLAAYESMVAAEADLAQAESNLWPKISLGGFYGAYDTPSTIAMASNPVWSLAAAISMPLFDFGRLNSAMKSADARKTQAILNYENSILLSLKEAHTALSHYLHGLNAVTIQEQALKHRKETVDLAKSRFEQGLTDATDLTTAQTELDQATIALIESKSNAAIAYINLHKALGLGA